MFTAAWTLSRTNLRFVIHVCNCLDAFQKNRFFVNSMLARILSRSNILLTKCLLLPRKKNIIWLTYVSCRPTPPLSLPSLPYPGLAPSCLKVAGGHLSKTCVSDALEQKVTLPCWLCCQPALCQLASSSHVPPSFFFVQAMRVSVHAQGVGGKLRM